MLCVVSVGGKMVSVVADAQKGDVVSLCIRADDITVHKRDAGMTSARNTFKGIIVRKTVAGSRVTITVDIGVKITAVVTSKSAEEMALDTGTLVGISFKATAIHVIREPLSD